jgi:hypothetical protein
VELLWWLFRALCRPWSCRAEIRQPHPYSVFCDLFRWVPKDAHTSKDLAAAQGTHSTGTDIAPTAANSQHSANTGLRAMSLENFAGPGTYSLFHQKEYLLTFPTPTRYVPRIALTCLFKYCAKSAVVSVQVWGASIMTAVSVGCLGLLSHFQGTQC